MAGGHGEQGADVQIGDLVRLLGAYRRPTNGKHFIVLGDVGGRRRWSALVQVLDARLAELVLGQIDRGAARSRSCVLWLLNSRLRLGQRLVLRWKRATLRFGRPLRQAAVIVQQHRQRGRRFDQGGRFWLHQKRFG